MRIKFLFWLFLIADCAFDRVQSQSSDDYSYKRRPAFDSRISGGDEYQSKVELDHPWLVGLHNRLTESFFCAGSLISNRHVLSGEVNVCFASPGFPIDLSILAAHCFHEKGVVEVMDPYHVLAMLGRFNVSDHDEAGSLNSLVWKIFIHPEWNFIDWKSNWDADISVVVLEDLIEFTAFIRPVRLPEASNKTEVEGDGTVVGWGHDNKSPNKEHEETPSKIKIPAVVFRQCILDAPKYASSHSWRTFCAGFSGRSIAPCSGDSGGGFYVEDISSKQNSIEGIVSNSAAQDTPGVCKADLYTTYTIVANFVPWIKEKVQETKERVVIDVEYTCKDNDGLTKCKPEAYENPLQDFVRFKLRDFPGDPKNVRKLILDFKENRVIEGISEAFPNLELLHKPYGNPIRIERRTFANMTKLKKLDLNDVEIITHHHFDDLVKLEELKLTSCRMPKQPKILSNVLRNLKRLSLYGGANWRILPGETFAGMSKMEELQLNTISLEEISENAFDDLVGLTKLSLVWNSIVKLPDGLFKNLRNLTWIDLNNNYIEELSRELFANNLMLEYIFLRDNKIKKIETDFTSLPKIERIVLEGNVCVDDVFGWVSSNTKTIQEFQGIIERQCTPK